MTDSEALYIARNYIKLLKRTIEDKDKLIENNMKVISEFNKISSEDKIAIKKDIRVVELSTELHKRNKTIHKDRLEIDRLINRNVLLAQKIEQFQQKQSLIQCKNIQMLVSK